VSLHHPTSAISTSRFIADTESAVSPASVSNVADAPSCSSSAAASCLPARAAV